MIVADEKEFIFVHIPRTAGTRISKSLCQAMGIDDWKQYIGEPTEVARRHETVREGYPGSTYEGKKHIKAKDLKSLVGGEKWESYFKFAFVRNPWDRAVSTYMHRRKVAPRLVKAIWPTSRRLFRWLLKAKYKLLRAESTQQVDYVTDGEGKLLVDFIGRFECLSKDFDVVCDRISVDAELGERYDPTKRRNYQEYYDEPCRRIIQDAKRDDIERFGYCFE